MLESTERVVVIGGTTTTRFAPAGRVGCPEGVAEAIGHLIGATFTTGVVLSVDGGSRLRPVVL